MNYIDYIIVILLVIAAIRGILKGFIYEVASLIALIGGVWGAIKFSGVTEMFLTGHLHFTGEYIGVIAFIITFILIIILVHFIGKAVEKIVDSISLGFVNRILGLLFSVVKTAFILGIILVLLEKIDESHPILPEKDIAASKLYSPLRGATVNTFPFIQKFYKNIMDGDHPDRDKGTEDGGNNNSGPQA